MTDARKSLLLRAEMENNMASTPEFFIAETRNEILAMALGGGEKVCFEVVYKVPGIGMYTEASVTRCSNGLAVNYTDPYGNKLNASSRSGNVFN